MGKCFADAGHESGATKLLFKKLGDEASDGLIHHADEVGIFSAENNLRLDAGGATCDPGHDSWATCFRVRALDGGALRHGTETGLSNPDPNPNPNPDPNPYHNAYGSVKHSLIHF